MTLTPGTLTCLDGDFFFLYLTINLHFASTLEYLLQEEYFRVIHEQSTGLCDGEDVIVQ